jgi:hypothetical protein
VVFLLNHLHKVSQKKKKKKKKAFDYNLSTLLTFAIDVAVARQISQNGMDVLTALGLVPPDGHRLVLEAANTLDRNPRFYWLLRELWANIRNLPTLFLCNILSLFTYAALLPESANLLVSGMSLINVIVNSPDELRVRVVLRNELFALGLDGLLWALSEHQSEKLANQLSTFTYLHEDGIFGSFLLILCITFLRLDNKICTTWKLALDR